MGFIPPTPENYFIMVPFAVKNTTLTRIFSNTVKKTFIYVYVNIMNFNDNRSKLVQLNIHLKTFIASFLETVI